MYFSSGSSTVAVVGLGKIGLPLAVQYARQGWQVIGCDINRQVVETINADRTHVQEEAELLEEVPRLVAEGRLHATLDIAGAVRQARVVVVIVPVLINELHEINFSNIEAATLAIGTGLQPDTLVIYETTLPVGTTASRLRTLLERSAHLQAGDDFLLAYSPERVSSGSIFSDLQSYPKVVGGIDARSTEAATDFYRSVLSAPIITMASTDEAEFVKLIETTYRDVNIALANEYALYADRHHLDVTAAIAAANTQPYSHIHMPGVGVGGHCIPVYPYFLLAGVETEAVEGASLPLLHLPRSARLINDAMAEYAVERVEEASGSLAGQVVLLLGVAYRGNVRETAFTSARLLHEALLRRGAAVYVDDPLFSDEELCTLGYTPLVPEAEEQVQAIILQADHQTYRTLDFSRFPQCRVVLDGRHVLQKEHIEAEGMHYIFSGDGKGKQAVACSPFAEDNRRVQQYVGERV